MGKNATDTTFVCYEITNTAVDYANIIGKLTLVEKTGAYRHKTLNEAAARAQDLVKSGAWGKFQILEVEFDARDFMCRGPIAGGGIAAGSMNPNMPAKLLSVPTNDAAFMAKLKLTDKEAQIEAQRNLLNKLELEKIELTHIIDDSQLN